MNANVQKMVKHKRYINIESDTLSVTLGIGYKI